MQSQMRQIEQVVRKLQLLPPDRVSEVEDFIEFLSRPGQDQQLVQAAMAASQPALSEIRNNAEDAEYDHEFGDYLLISFLSQAFKPAGFIPQARRAPADRRGTKTAPRAHWRHAGNRGPGHGRPALGIPPA